MALIVLAISLAWVGIWLALWFGALRLANRLLPKGLAPGDGSDVRLWLSLVHLFIGGILLYQATTGSVVWVLGIAFFFGGGHPDLTLFNLIAGLILVLDGHVLLGAARRLLRIGRGQR